MGDRRNGGRSRAVGPVSETERARTQSTNCGAGTHATDATRQSRAGSLLEAVANVIAGYLLALLTQQLVLPLFGIELGLAAHAGIAGVFTIVSLLRSYLLPRLFDHLAWQRQEDLRLKRQRLERRFARGPG